MGRVFSPEGRRWRGRLNHDFLDAEVWLAVSTWDDGRDNNKDGGYEIWTNIQWLGFPADFDFNDLF